MDNFAQSHGPPFLMQKLKIVEGDLAVQYNPNLTSLAGAAQSLTTIKGQVNSPGT